MRCKNCGDELRPVYYIDRLNRKRMISGLKCRYCLKSEITYDMTIEQYKYIQAEYKLKFELNDTFLKKYLDGGMTFNSLNNWIESWHNTDESRISLKDKLGLSDEDYEYMGKCSDADFKIYIDNKYKNRL